MKKKGIRVPWNKIGTASDCLGESSSSDEKNRSTHNQSAWGIPLQATVIVLFVEKCWNTKKEVRALKCYFQFLLLAIFSIYRFFLNPIFSRTRTRRPPDSQTPTATPSTISVGLGSSSWGSVRSNALEDGDDEIDSEKNSARKSTSKSSNSHPLEKLRGFESSSKDMTATNHSHFEWGATVVTRAPGRKNNKHK